MKKVPLILLAAVLLLLVGLAACGQQEEQTELAIYALADAVSASTFDDFGEEKGIACTVTFFDTAEELYQRLRTGGQPDVVVTRDYSAARMIAENRLLELDTDSMTNLPGIDRIYRFPGYDPDNVYTASVSAGTMGILYDTGTVTETVTSWSGLWAERTSGNIVLPQESRYIMGIALLSLGYDVNSADEGQLAEARTLVDAAKPVIYLSASSKDSFVSMAKEGAIIVTTSAQAAADMACDDDLAFVLPESGVIRYVNAAAVCAGAAEPGLAFQLIDYLCNPQVMADSTAQTGSSVTSSAAYDLLADEIQDSVVLYPSEDTLEGAVFFSWPAGTDSLVSAWRVFDSCTAEPDGNGTDAVDSAESGSGEASENEAP